MGASATEGFFFFRKMRLKMREPLRDITNFALNGKRLSYKRLRFSRYCGAVPGSRSTLTLLADEPSVLQQFERRILFVRNDFAFAEQFGQRSNV